MKSKSKKQSAKLARQQKAWRPVPPPLKPRKPGPLNRGEWLKATVSPSCEALVANGGYGSADARSLAAWLMRYAEWREGQS